VTLPAADNGLPPLEGVDPMLRDALGADYGPFDTTRWAGIFAAKEMRETRLQARRKPASADEGLYREDGQGLH
jgi:hypothetical protein